MPLESEQRSETQTPAREVISSSELRRLLDEAFREALPRPCALCHVPLPYFWEPSDGTSENWRIGAPWKCSRGCHDLIITAALRLATRYDVRPPFKV
jgi:hypothetical protein